METIEESIVDDDDEIIPEIDFSRAERGRYDGREFNYGLMVSIDKDLALVFDNAEKVNRALRLIVELGELTLLLGRTDESAPSVEKRTLVLAESKSTYDANRPDEGE